MADLAALTPSQWAFLLTDIPIIYLSWIASKYARLSGLALVATGLVDVVRVGRRPRGLLVAIPRAPGGLCVCAHSASRSTQPWRLCLCGVRWGWGGAGVWGL
jgi:hypothetical protein